MTEIKSIPPPVLWAQRNNIVFLTFLVEDCTKPEIKIETDKIYFKGVGGVEKKQYENTINLYKEVDSEKSRYYVRDRIIEVILVKLKEAPYWPHLTKEKMKYHWLKVDFSKWNDEDESGDEQQPPMGLDDLMGQFGGGAAPGDKPSLDDIEGMAEDSDDEDLPDLE